MLNLYRENGILYAEAKLLMRFPVVHNSVTYASKKGEVSYEDVDVIHSLLKLNHKVLVNIGVRGFVKPDLLEFGRMLDDKKYNIIDGLPTAKKSEPTKPVTEEVKKQEPVQQVVAEVPVMEEDQNVEVESTVEHENNVSTDNRKPKNKERYKNNHPQQQGGDK